MNASKYGCSVEGIQTFDRMSRQADMVMPYVRLKSRARKFSEA